MRACVCMYVRECVHACVCLWVCVSVGVCMYVCVSSQCLSVKWLSTKRQETVVTGDKKLNIRMCRNYF